ncbi:glycosyltransferase family 2 protein [Candidatus Daviesbacteria bacterium]|nr:glycosyltransferase family 2 protein [Candidatus Daviesbacteria bacterium]
MPETSIIIRTKNEEKWLGEVLKRLFGQTYKDFEVIIIDSGSTDKTLEIAKKFPVTILQIPPKDFSYPYALNYAITRSKATKYIAIISGHSIPVSDKFLEEGIKDFERFDKIMGVFGIWQALPDGTIWDKLIINIGFGFPDKYFRRRILEKKMRAGTMQFTNSIILKSLWEKRKFNEKFGMGGEDMEWADYWFKKGYWAVWDRALTVQHSHHLSLKGWQKQFKHWSTLSKPLPFEPLKFRKSKTHSPLN